MAIEPGPPFEPKAFLAEAGKGRSIGKYRKDQVVFSQGDAADSVLQGQAHRCF
jgi:CRP/FNR family cyclic AMP-dependent transcriptional regulator